MDPSERPTCHGGRVGYDDLLSVTAMLLLSTSLFVSCAEPTVRRLPVVTRAAGAHTHYELGYFGVSVGREWIVKREANWVGGRRAQQRIVFEGRRMGPGLPPSISLRAYGYVVSDAAIAEHLSGYPSVAWQRRTVSVDGSPGTVIESSSTPQGIPRETHVFVGWSDRVLAVYAYNVDRETVASVVRSIRLH